MEEHEQAEWGDVMSDEYWDTIPDELLEQSLQEIMELAASDAEIDPITAIPDRQELTDADNEAANILRASEASAVKVAKVLRTVTKTYPLLPLDVSGLTHEGLVKWSVELASEFRKSKDYTSIRDDFIHVSLALNQFGLLAPVFRDQPKMPFKRAEWKAFTPLLIDQIVIDLHWLHCRGEKVNPRWPELKTLLAPSSKFDCDAVANRLAAKNWSSDFRVQELLFVNDRQQRQLVQLRSKSLKETFRNVLEGKGKPDKADGRVAPTVAAVRMAIGNWADRTHQIRGHEDIYESLWVARELLGAKASNDEIGELAALMCGTPPLDRKTVAGKLKRLDAKLREVGVA